jgi:hypothetical protein
MEFDDGRRHVTRHDPPFNWFLPLAFVLCVVFWLLVASAFANSF